MAKAWMQVILSLVLLVAGLAIVFAPLFLGTKVDDNLQKIATGWIGALIGYWLA